MSFTKEVDMYETGDEEKLNEVARLAASVSLVPHRYCCPKGHEWEAESPPWVEFTVGTQQGIRGIVCLLCAGEALFERFPVTDMGEVTEDADKR